MSDLIENVLIVDDDVCDYVFLKKAIEKKLVNVNIEYCSDYESALPVINQTKFDILFLDYDLGIYKGVDILRDLKKYDIDVPVLFVSGNSNPKLKDELIDEGALGFIDKNKFDLACLNRYIA